MAYPGISPERLRKPSHGTLIYQGNPVTVPETCKEIQSRYSKLPRKPSHGTRNYQGNPVTVLETTKETQPWYPKLPRKSSHGTRNYQGNPVTVPENYQENPAMVPETTALRHAWLPEPLVVPLHFTCICCVICLYVFLSAGGCLPIVILIGYLLSALSLYLLGDNFSEKECCKSSLQASVSTRVGREQRLSNLDFNQTAIHN
jgi:hypothetical protein